MCGIVAARGRGDVSGMCVAGLKRLQYRGYDSFGFAWCGSAGLQRLRCTDPLDELYEQLPASAAMLGHTRWATHGSVNMANCHPHVSRDGEFALVHNGIVENFQSLQRELVDSGRRFDSQTDTEVIVGLIEAALSGGASRRAALAAACRQLEGRNTIVMLFGDGELYGVRHGSPLVLGDDGANLFVASDVLSFLPFTNRCFVMPESSLVCIDRERCELFDIDGMALPIEWITVEGEQQDIGRDGHPHYMIKEILEQWQTVAAQAAVDDAAFGALSAAIRNASRVIVTGAGGASYAGAQIAWLLRQVAGIPAWSVPAYELESMRHCVAPGDVLLAVSQSGETADTLEAVRTASLWGMRVASLVNMPLSTLTRISEFSFFNRSGPEVCVLSTKSASAQITFGYLLAHFLAGQVNEARRAIEQLSAELSRYLDDRSLSRIRDIAGRIVTHEHLFVLGKGECYGAALMAALNIKEASYLHAEAFAAGELKHGVIALIEPGVPVIVFVPDGSRYMLNAVAEVKSRGAFVVALADRDNELFDAFIPLPAATGSAVTISSIIPCQILAYFLATHRGLNPDRPRNLAKSVTVQ